MRGAPKRVQFAQHAVNSLRRDLLVDKPFPFENLAALPLRRALSSDNLIPMPSVTWDLAAIAPRLQDMMARWEGNTSSERAALQSFILELCAALGVAAPVPPTGAYQFEFPVQVVDRDGRETTNFIDCWKADHFALEGKATGDEIPNDNRLRKAFGQVRTYVAHVSGAAPPYLMVLDVPRHLIVWDRWSGQYGDFAAGRRIDLATLHTRPEEIALLCDIFEQPRERDPRAKAQSVTKEIAAKLAELAAVLEARGSDQERVARFLMRCVFSCFAEDVGLLPAGIFRRTLEAGRAGGGAERVALALTGLWQTMDSGGMFGAEQLERFNGHFFKTVEALPLEPREVDLLIEASHFDWSRVEPSIFGTLLVRALDPEERHRLGAEYTPREYIERLVEPTVVEPIREKWTAVQAAVLQFDLADKNKRKRKQNRDAATAELLKFHAWLRGLSFLDPACGSGNFLYVTMAAVKRIELEVLNEIQRVAEGQSGLVLDEVHPRQFHGLEVKPWAREIAELTLWIGYHQFWREMHGGRTPPIPILEDTGTLECRDAVLAWDEIVRRPERDRPDPTPRIVSPITGALVPDPNATLPYSAFVNARPAVWPRADFIVGNPPYIGTKRLRDTLGDGYVDGLRAAYPALTDSADFVMYWWSRAASLVASGEVLRAGLITTNSIAQIQNRQVIADARSQGARIIWAAPDHPWVDGIDAAAVTVALTVLSREESVARLVQVGDNGSVLSVKFASSINDDLTVHANVAAAAESPLDANKGLAAFGFALHGKGFLLEEAEARHILEIDPRYSEVIKPYRGGRDLAQRDRGLWVVDFAYLEENEARAFPVAFDIVRDRVKPERDANARDVIRRYWWRFGWPRRELREALVGLGHYIGTTETTKHRFFTLLDSRVAPDHMVVVVASDDAFLLGVLSSRLHVEWSLAAGGDLGGNTPRYNKSRCFDPFPFPSPSDDQRSAIARIGIQIDAHRSAALAHDARVTMTGMYNVVDKLRSGAVLTPAELVVHELAACGVLRDLHDNLDSLVAEAYGWPWPMDRDEILARLVALHDERIAEEKRGSVRWLRPEYQIPRFAPEGAAPALLGLLESPAVPPPEELRPWPSTAVDQLGAIGAAIALVPRTVDDVVAAFAGARKDLVTRHLETLAMMGEIALDDQGRYQVAKRVA
jgi:hypothetical protein